MVNFLRKLFLNYQIKLFILAFAVLLWFYVSLEETYEYTIPVRIVPTNVRSNYLIANNYPKEALVKFRGKGKSLFALKSSDRKIQLNLSHFRRRAIFRLRPELVEIPPTLSVEIVQIIRPDTVIFKLERKMEKDLRVIPNISASLEPGYIIVGAIKTEPVTVHVSGPKSVVDTMKVIYTQKLFFNHVKSAISGTVRVESPLNKFISVIPQMIHYLIDVQQLGEKTIKDIPVNLIHAPKNRQVRVIPSTISVTIEGGVNLLDSVTAKDIYVYIDYKQGKVKHGDYKAIIELPPETRFSNAFPHTFKVIVE